MLWRRTHFRIAGSIWRTPVMNPGLLGPELTTKPTGPTKMEVTWAFLSSIQAVVTSAVWLKVSALHPSLKRILFKSSFLSSSLLRKNGGSRCFWDELNQVEAKTRQKQIIPESFGQSQTILWKILSIATFKTWIICDPCPWEIWSKILERRSYRCLFFYLCGTNTR